jgi:hypothetical protein
MSNLKLHRRGGPTTEIGKKHSSRNAHRHGLFAAEFSFSAVEESQFTKLKEGLREELKPNNALLDLIFQDVLTCAWRVRLSLRCEQSELQKQFAIENEESPQGLSRVRGTFPDSPNAVFKQRVEILKNLHTSITTSGRVPPEFEEQVTRAFGPVFSKQVAQWASGDGVRFWSASLMEIAEERQRVFGLEPSFAPPSAEEKKRISESNDLKEIEATRKLIEVVIDILVNNFCPVESGGALLNERASRLDLFIRYSTTARRDFYRSLREYWEAKNHN